MLDKTRASSGKHTLWAYSHTPAYSKENMTENIEKQIERFAPGFREIILKRSVMNTEDFRNYNYNYIGGDINGGSQDWKQLFARPVISFNPYKLPLKGMYLFFINSDGRRCSWYVRL